MVRTFPLDAGVIFMVVIMKMSVAVKRAAMVVRVRVLMDVCKRRLRKGKSKHTRHDDAEELSHPPAQTVLIQFYCAPPSAGHRLGTQPSIRYSAIGNGSEVVSMPKECQPDSRGKIIEWTTLESALGFSSRRGRFYDLPSVE
jgi:hypothetical protein